MAEAHRKQKQPEHVRRMLIEEAARLASKEGLSAVTVQAAADAAGVTKGGLTHHFPNKQALMNAVFQLMLDTFDSAINERMAADQTLYGSFTRAYVGACFDADSNISAPLVLSLLADVDLRQRWTKWYEARLEQHKSTDNAPELTIVRLAADGLWLSDISGVQLADRNVLRDHLLSATKHRCR